MFVSDTGTMITEAAILGTPAIQCYSDFGHCGNLLELEQKYGLVYTFKEPALAITQAINLVQQPDLKEQWAKKRQILLRDKIDVTQFFVDFLENYPISFRKYKGKRVSLYEQSRLAEHNDFSP
jgi:predicted glycosyltransferase